MKHCNSMVRKCPQTMTFSGLVRWGWIFRRDRFVGSAAIEIVPLLGFYSSRRPRLPERSPSATRSISGSLRSTPGRRPPSSSLPSPEDSGRRPFPFPNLDSHSEGQRPRWLLTIRAPFALRASLTASRSCLPVSTHPSSVTTHSSVSTFILNALNP